MTGAQTDEDRARALHGTLLASDSGQWPEITRLQRAGLLRVRANSQHTATILFAPYVREDAARD